MEKNIIQAMSGLGIRDTLPETNIAPENQWLEDEISWFSRFFQFGACFDGQETIGRTLAPR